MQDTCFSTIRLWNSSRFGTLRPGRHRPAGTFCGLSSEVFGPSLAWSANVAPVSGKLGPSGRLKSQRQAKHIPIERHRSLHVAHKYDRVVYSHSKRPYSVEIVTAATM